MKIVLNKNEHTSDRQNPSKIYVIITLSLSNYIRQKRSYASFENSVSDNIRRTEQSF